MNERFTLSQPKQGENFQVVEFSQGARLDSTIAPVFSNALQEVSTYMAIVDLSNADYVSSAVLREMASSVKQRRKRQEDLSLVAPKGTRPRDVLDLAGLDSIFRIYENRQDAVNAAQSTNS